MSPENHEEKDDQVASKGPTFDEMVDFRKWQPVEDYYETADDMIATDVREAVGLRKRLREELLADPEISGRVRVVSPEMMSWAKEQLFQGRVCAVDGTVSRSPSLSGGRARIAVAATSYLGNRIQRVLYVSYRQMAGPISSAIEYFQQLKRVNKTSELLMRAVMAYAERSLALQRTEDWRLVHGEILPYELWAGLGKGRPLQTRLNLAESLIQAKGIVAVVEGSHNVQLLNAGELLSPGEYLDAVDLRAELEDFQRGHRDDGRGAHFRKEEGEQFEAFVERYGKEIRVGIFKAGMKTYIFHAHREFFDKAAAIIIADSSNQPIRGFPLLIDYADHILRHYMAQRDFDRQVQFKTARLGFEQLAAEIDPRRTRRP